MDDKILAKTILLVWLYFTIRILFVTYWDALFLPPILLVLDSLFKDSKSNCQTQTANHFQTRKRKSENNKEVKKEQDQKLTVKDMDSEKITSPALEKIQELISELQNSLTSDSKNGAALPNFSTLATENPTKKIISTNKISASSEEDNLTNGKTSPAIVKIQELIFDLQNSLK
ncbi:hypothetical protein TNCV_1558051 [Trichonephila clavipes]|uniref:Uncharacterized protein n=1 Tax=Trichonephila clavipes TaxID=2585209 RepID=A0A8X6R612_TRICX|nr:hypothetical protein TNCV_1558051 [Trichonephila clavipes]